MRDGTQGDRPSCRPQAQDRPRLALRFRAYGERKYITLGTDAEGWDHKRAETELEGELAKVRAGVWRSPHPEPAPDPPTDPSFHEFASEWFAAKRHEIAPNTVTDYEWRLTHHLLPFFATHRLSQITVAEVDHYKTAKLREADELRRRIDAGEVVRQQNGQRRRPLSASTINKTITLLSVILDVAEERELIARNPARGKRRRVKERQPKRTQLDTATAITALLGAAGELDAEAQQHPQIEKRVFPRRAIVATLLLGGPRIGS